MTFPLICIECLFDLTNQMLKLTGKCLVTGCYHKHCLKQIVSLHIGTLEEALKEEKRILKDDEDSDKVEGNGAYAKAGSVKKTGKKRKNTPVSS